jgi:hypothetical protein
MNSMVSLKTDSALPAGRAIHPGSRSKPQTNPSSLPRRNRRANRQDWIQLSQDMVPAAPTARTSPQAPLRAGGCCTGGRPVSGC